MPVPPPAPVTFLVVGDMHRHWRAADRTFLEQGDQELTLFVGDLGDEDEDLVREIAGLQAAKVVMLGNHDAWQSFSRRKATPRLQRSLEALDGDHLAYGVREVPRAGLSVVGGRPFSWGGTSLRSPELYQRLYGISTMADSAERIFDAARSAQHRDLLLLAHNGPTGLSNEPQDIYGKDFGTKPGGDWGDLDLEMAIDHITRSGWRISCVVAGHMHDRVLRPRGEMRRRFVRRKGILYLNPAVVPRLKQIEGATVAHYLRLSFLGGELKGFEEIWVDAEGVVREVEEPEVRELD